MRSRRSWGALTAFLMALLISGSCGTAIDGIGVIVTFTNTPAASTQINVKFTINGMPQKQTEPYVVKQDLTRFAVGITDMGAGTLVIEATAVDELGCIVGKGTATVPVVVGSKSLESTLEFTPVSTCPVNLTIVGTGSVKLGSMTCTQNCSIDAERSMPVTLSANLPKAIASGTWGGDCSGSLPTPCMVTPDRIRNVTMTFVARSCTTNFCAYPSPAAAQIRSVLVIPTTGLPVVLFGGLGLYNLQNFQFAPVSSNIPTTSPIRTLAGDSATYLCALFEDGAISCNATSGNLNTFASVTPPGGFGKPVAMSQGGGFFVVSDTGKIGDLNSVTRAMTTETVTNTMPLYGVADSAANGSAVAVGQGGVIFRKNGTSWVQVASPTTKTLRAIWLDANDIWLVGESGIILRANAAAGPYIQEAAGDGRTLNATWGSLNTNWAVGDSGSARKDNASVTLPTVPNVPNLISISGYNQLSIVWIVGTGDVAFGP